MNPNAPASRGDSNGTVNVSTGGLVVPEQVAGALAGKRFAVAGFDAADASRIVSVIEAANAFARVVRLPESGMPPAILAPYDASILRAVPEPESGFGSALELMARSGKPSLLIGTRAELVDQVAALRPLAHDFLIQPWEAGDLLLRSYRLVSRIVETAGAGQPRKDGISVVVADDDPTIRMMVSTILRNYELRCEVARDGSEAVEMMRMFLPRVAIVDVNMPRMDGFEVLASLKGDPATRGIRVLMLSARQHETDVVRGFALGADDYVTKPFSPMELVARVKRALRSAL
jgi:DNA-binding response OmpR family regulator